jgi:hypothetical protein
LEALYKGLGMAYKGLSVSHKGLGAIHKDLGAIHKGLGIAHKGLGVLKKNLGGAPENKGGLDMSKAKDYIPGPDAEFDGWLANLTAYVDAKTAAGDWTHIPADKVRDLKQHNTDWHRAYAKTRGPHTRVDTEAKNDARKEAAGFVRPFAAQYLKFDPVSNEDRTALGLHNRDATHSAIETPKTRALITGLKALGGFQVELRFQDEGAPGSRAIPYGCNGCLLNYTWGPEKVRDYAALKESQLMTRSPWVITLPPEAEGNFFSGAARWQSERAELGPWGEVQSTVIA